MDYSRLFFEWLFEKFGLQHPRLSFLGVFVFAGLIGCFVWWMVGYKYRRDHPQHVETSQATGSSPGTSSAEPAFDGRTIKTEKRNGASEHRSAEQQTAKAVENTGQKQPAAHGPL
jgi:cytoskeletal protein RodZ